MKVFVSLLLFAALFYLRLRCAAHAAQRDRPSHNRAIGRRSRATLRTLSVAGAIFASVVFGAAVSGEAASRRVSGVYLTAADYKDSRLDFQGECGSKAHKLELHDVLNKSYIDMTHAAEKRRYQKSDVFGFRACNGRDYRFVSNLEYQILEAKELYIYEHETSERVGKTVGMVRRYYFSVGPSGQVLPLTLENLQRAFPDNHRFHDSLDQMFGGGQNVAQYDELHKMFKVNRLLMASREP